MPFDHGDLTRTVRMTCHCHWSDVPTRNRILIAHVAGERSKTGCPVIQPKVFNSLQENFHSTNSIKLITLFTGSDVDICHTWFIWQKILQRRRLNLSGVMFENLTLSPSPPFSLSMLSPVVWRDNWNETFHLWWKITCPPISYHIQLWHSVLVFSHTQTSIRWYQSETYIKDSVPKGIEC